ncbi:MAG: hypothetical protein R6V77_07865 [Candidatus Cloacimonadaceae bacterium]
MSYPLLQRILLCLFLLFVFVKLSAQGSFDIDAFTDPAKYGWTQWEDRINYRYDLTERQKLLQLYEMDAQSISGNILKSAVFPGWGQFNARSYTKGQVILAVEIAMLGSAYFFYDRAMDNYEKYQNSTQIDDMNAYYHDALVPYQYSLVFMTFATVVWAYNIFDVVQTTERYNADVWQKTLRNYYNAPVQITPTGFQIRF